MTSEVGSKGAPLAYYAYWPCFPAAAAAVFLIASHLVASRLGLAIIGFAITVEGIALLFNVRDSSDRVVDHLNGLRGPPMMATVPPWGWRFQGAGLMVIGIAFVVRAAID